MDGMVCDGSKCQNLNTWALFWINQAQMKQCRTKVPLGLWLMVGVFSLNVPGFCRMHSSCLFSCMVVRQ